MRELKRHETDAIFEQLEALRLGDEDPGPASVRSAALDGQSGRASEIRGAGEGREGTPRAGSQDCRGATEEGEDVKRHAVPAAEESTSRSRDNGDSGR